MFFEEKSPSRLTPRGNSPSFLSKILIVAAVMVLGNGILRADATSSACPVRAFGAAGDGQKLDTSAINAAIQACHSRGGGTVVFDAGTYRTGTIHRLDNITLKFEPGSTILGSPDLRDYPPIEKASEERDTVAFKYDPFGRRVQKSFTQPGNPPTTTVTNYPYHGDNLIEEVNASVNIVAMTCPLFPLS